ncbi:DUF6735 family protein [Haloarchaeobius sp. DYHT-AS-18]|uniref:DUF6735 family protein n=1 Tax=Haloarchaeobius sp. DYHT-AS-18 TaxID=3446117 RepID=UPI003EBF15C6
MYQRLEPAEAMNVGHRALVAYQRADGRLSIHHSQWGALGWQLLTTCRPNSPFGGNNDWEAQCHEAIVDGEEPDPPNVPDTPVDPHPRTVVADLDDLTGQFDFLEYEACYVVSRSVDVRGFQPLWFARALPDADPVGDGALVSLRRDRDPVEDAARLTAWFRGVADTMVAMQEQGALTDDAVHTHLRERCREWEADGREVYVG